MVVSALSVPVHFWPIFLVMMLTTPPSASEPKGRTSGRAPLDTFDGIHRDPVKVEVIVAEDGVAGVDAFPVDEDQGIAAAQTANADALAVIPFVSELDPRDIAQYVFQVLDGLTL